MTHRIGSGWAAPGDPHSRWGLFMSWHPQEQEGRKSEEEVMAPCDLSQASFCLPECSQTLFSVWGTPRGGRP